MNTKLWHSKAKQLIENHTKIELCTTKTVGYREVQIWMTVFTKKLQIAKYRILGKNPSTLHFYIFGKKLTPYDVENTHQSHSIKIKHQK